MIHYITFCYIISQITQADNRVTPVTTEMSIFAYLTNAIPVVYYTLVGYLDTETLEVGIHADL